MEVHPPAEGGREPRLELVGHLAAMLRAAGMEGLGARGQPKNAKSPSAGCRWAWYVLEFGIVGCGDPKPPTIAAEGLRLTPHILRCAPARRLCARVGRKGRLLHSLKADTTRGRQCRYAGTMEWLHALPLHAVAAALQIAPDRSSCSLSCLQRITAISLCLISAKSISAPRPGLVGRMHQAVRVDLDILHQAVLLRAVRQQHLEELGVRGSRR